MQTQTEHNDFKFFLPVDIQKGTNSKGDKVYKISGQASKQRRDSQGETMSLKGMDISNLKVINWNHKSKDDPSAYLGEVNEVTFKGDVMNFKGELFPEMPMAKGAINLMKALKTRGKQLGISVEGSVVERGSKDPKNPAYNNVVKSKLTALALTPNPINSDTFVDLLEKGHTNNLDWEFDEDTEVLMKSFESGELEKAYTAEGNQEVQKEDVEGPKNKKKSDKKLTDVEVEGENKETLLKKISKADVYERIFSYFYKIDVIKAKKIYNLIEKLTPMKDNVKEITEETINKAFEMLEDSGDAVEGTEIEKSEEVILAEKDKAERDEMVDKATVVAKGLISQKLGKEEVAEKMILKGYGEKIIDEAYEAASKVETTFKSEIVVDNTEVLKAVSESNSNINKKFGAMADIFKSQSEQTAELLSANVDLKGDLKKSYDTITELNDTISSFAKTPGTRRAATKFVEKDFNNGESIQKSEGSVKTFDVKNHGQRKALIGFLTEQSGINKGGDYDKELIEISQNLEVAKSVDVKSMGRLNAMDIEIIQ